MNRARLVKPLRREVCKLLLGAPVLLRPCHASAAARRDVEVESFRRPNMSDRQVLQEAFTAWDQRAGGRFVFGGTRTYDLGPLDRNAPPFILDGAAGVSIVGNGA